jgi:hypothetical protein
VIVDVLQSGYQKKLAKQRERTAAARDEVATEGAAR